MRPDHAELPGGLPVQLGVRHLGAGDAAAGAAGGLPPLHAAGADRDRSRAVFQPNILPDIVRAVAHRKAARDRLQPRQGAHLQGSIFYNVERPADQSERAAAVPRQAHAEHRPPAPDFPCRDRPHAQVT